MKVAAIVVVAAMVASATYTAWLNAQEQKKMRGPQPLLGATYYKQNQKK
jgi:hypothetical protein